MIFFLITQTARAGVHLGINVAKELPYFADLALIFSGQQI